MLVYDSTKKNWILKQIFDVVAEISAEQSRKARSPKAILAWIGQRI